MSPRTLPRGVVMDGGSDWIGLYREFAQYVIDSRDQLVTGLKQLYKYSLLPVEVRAQILSCLRSLFEASLL